MRAHAVDIAHVANNREVGPESALICSGSGKEAAANLSPAAKDEAPKKRGRPAGWNIFLFKISV